MGLCVKYIIALLILLVISPARAHDKFEYKEITRTPVSVRPPYTWYLITYTQPKQTIQYLQNKNYLDWEILSRTFDIRNIDLGIKIQVERKF